MSKKNYLVIQVKYKIIKFNLYQKIFIHLEPLALPLPTSNASISNTKVTRTLKNPHERPKIAIFTDSQKRYPRPQTLAGQYDDKIKKQREHDSIIASQSVDTT